MSDFPIPQNYIDVWRQAKTRIDVLHEATIDDNWNTDGDKSLSEPWIGMTRLELLNKNPPEGQMWVQGRLTTKIPDDDPDCGEIMNNARRTLETGREKAMHCKVTKPANPNGSSWSDPLYK